MDSSVIFNTVSNSSKKKARILVADERAGEEAEQPKTMMDDSLDHVREGEKETATNDEKESVASLSQAGVAGEDRGGTENEDKEDTTGVYKEGVAEEEKGSMAKDVSEEVLGGESEVRTGKDSEHDQLLSSGSHTFSPVHGSDGGISGSETERGTRGHPNHQPSCSSTDELLAIMGAEQPSQHSHPDHISQSTSESSGDNNILQLSENLCFLHLRVSHKSSAAHTYTPVNMAMGIDIPQNQPPRGFIQQVKSNFCFAVEERR